MTRSRPRGKVNTYNIGSQVRLVITTALGGSDADPTSLMLKVRPPAGAERELAYGVDAALVKDSVGHYHYDLTLTTSGVWWYRSEATGAVVAAAESGLQVSLSQFS
jgi:hypothetical protein